MHNSVPPSNGEIASFFEDLNRTVFAGDPVANPLISVEIVLRAAVGPFDVAVVTAPWTITALVFGPAQLPDPIAVGGVPKPAIPITTEKMGSYTSVPLLGDLSPVASQDQAIHLGTTLGNSLVKAIESTLELHSVEDPGRRAVFRSVVPPRDAPGL